MSKEKLPAYIVRMKKEKKKLKKKIEKILDFMENNSEYKNLSQFDKDLLTSQGSAMITYSNILEIRIRRAIEQCEDEWETVDKETVAGGKAEIIIEKRKGKKKIKTFDNIDDVIKDMIKTINEARKEKMEEEEDGRNS